MHIYWSECIDLYTNLYAEQCSPARKPCSKPKSPEVTSFASAQDSGRQTSLHIEICIGIDELKPNRDVRTKN